MRKIKAISCLSTVMIMALIFFFSSQTSNDSTEVSEGLAKYIIDMFFSSFDDAKKEALLGTVNGIMRKVAHYTLFAMLGTSVMCNIKCFRDINNIKASVYTFIVCVIYAISDEVHQNFVDGRTMQLSDLLTDSFGVLSGILVFWIIFRFYKICKPKKRRRGIHEY